MKQTSFDHQFVEFIPPDLREGMLYVSIPYATAAHLCACGCGNKVVTPISPADWQLIFNGDSVSLTPSIGNWAFLCKSHYWIRAGTVRWAPRWTDRQIAEGRDRDAADRDAYYAGRAVGADNGVAEGQPAVTSAHVRVFAKLRRRLTPRSRHSLK